MENKIFDKVEFSICKSETISDNYGTRTHYLLELYYNANTYVFDYTDSVMAYKNGEDLNYRNVMECLLLDKSAYDSCRDIDDFQAEFGYDKVSECLKAYNVCKETSEALERIFTEEELEQLQEEFSD